MSFRITVILFRMANNNAYCINSRYFVVTNISGKTWCRACNYSFIVLKIIGERQKGGDLTQSYDKSPYTHGNVKRAVTTQTTPQKSSIKQRLRTDLGRSVGVTTATQLVWFTRFTGPNLPTHRNSRVIEDKNMQMVHYSDIKVANIWNIEKIFKW